MEPTVTPARAISSGRLGGCGRAGQLGQAVAGAAGAAARVSRIQLPCIVVYTCKMHACTSLFARALAAYLDSWALLRCIKATSNARICCWIHHVLAQITMHLLDCRQRAADHTMLLSSTPAQTATAALHRLGRRICTNTPATTRACRAPGLGGGVHEHPGRQLGNRV